MTDVDEQLPTRALDAIIFNTVNEYDVLRESANHNRRKRFMTINCDGDISFDSTSTLTWTGTIRIMFLDDTDSIVYNYINASSITGGANYIFWARLNQTNATAITGNFTNWATFDRAGDLSNQSGDVVVLGMTNGTTFFSSNWSFGNLNPIYSGVLRSGFNVSGGGTIGWDGTNISWSQRFIVMGNGEGSYFSTIGYFDITMPTSGTATGYGGAASLTWTTSGLPLGSWSALWYKLPIGSNNTSVATNFYVTNYNHNDFVVPSDWILIAVRNNDGNIVRFCNGVTLYAGQISNAQNLPVVNINQTGVTNLTYINASSGYYSYYHLGTYVNNGTSTQGTIVFALNHAGAVMYQAEFHGYVYASNAYGHFKIILGWYNNGTGIYFCTATVVGNAPFYNNATIRVGMDANNNSVILFGTTTQALQYPKLTLERLTVSHGGLGTDFTATVSAVTSESAYSGIVGATVSYYGYNAKAYGTVSNAQYNDFADYWGFADEPIKMGKVYSKIDNSNRAIISNKKADKKALGIASDTWGFASGEDKMRGNIPVAVSGFVLAFVDKIYEPGTLLTNDKDGNLTKARFWHIIFRRILAKYDHKEPKKERHWVKVI